eukprot:jgi/Orpsp1_1/1187669/evm.model.d7180000059321.1
MYHVSEDNTIIGIPDPADGYYLIKEDLIFDTDGDDQPENEEDGDTLILCKDKKCNARDSPKEGFYTNAGGSKIISCTAGNAQNPTITCELYSEEGYYLDINNVLNYCDEKDKCSPIESPAPGYYSNDGDSENPYIFCMEGKCSTISTIKEELVNCENKNQIGMLSSHLGDDPEGEAGPESEGIGICLNGNAIVSSPFCEPETPSEDYEYGFMKYSQTGIFKSYVIRSNHYGLIKITDKQITLETENTIQTFCVDKDLMGTPLKPTEEGGEENDEDGDCEEDELEFSCNAYGICRRGPEPPSNSLYDQDSVSTECDVATRNSYCKTGKYYLVDKLANNAITDEEGVLFLCSDDKCNEIYDPGYYINDASEAYQCFNDKEDDGTFKCVKVDYKTECTADNIGKLYVAGGKIYFCINYDSSAAEGKQAKSVELNNDNIGNYILERVDEDDDDIFEFDSNEDDFEYALISIGEKEIKLNRN